MERRSSKSWSFGADLLLLGVLAHSCAPAPGRVDVRFEWEGGRPAFEEDVYFLLSVEIDGSVIAHTGPKVLRQGEPLDFPPFPHGRDRILTAEILTSRFTNSRALFAGRSAPFDLEAGDEIELPVSLHPVEPSAPRPVGPKAPAPTRIVYELRPYRTDAGEPRYLIEGSPEAVEPEATVIAFSAEEVAGATELGQAVASADGSFSLVVPPEVAPSMGQVYVATVDDRNRLSDDGADPDLQATLVFQRLLVTSVGSDSPHIVSRSAAFDLQANEVAGELGAPLEPAEADRLVAVDAQTVEARADGVWRDRTRTGDTVGPGPRTRHQMAFDRARNRVVLFGGFTENRELMADTWALDRFGWHRIGADGPAPPARFGHRMVYDDARDEVVLFGGFNNDFAATDTWIFDGRQWRALDAQPAPPPRIGPAMAYDPVRRVTVLFGGIGQNAQGLDLLFDDTWIFDGETWRSVPASVGPPARVHGAMRYLGTLDRIVLFGGRSLGGEGSGPMDDTWLFDTSSLTWRELEIDGPPARDKHNLVPDPSLGGLVLFGGEGPPLQTRSDAWLFDGAAWTDLGDLGISDRAYHGMAGANDGFWVVGGQPDVTAPDVLADVYRVRDGTAEAIDLRQDQPAARSGAAITYDPIRTLLLLYGGFESDLSVRRWYGDAWCWDGRSWTEVDTGGIPALEFPKLAFEDRSETIVLVGKGPFGMETWRWDGGAWSPAVAGTATAAWGALPSRTELGMERDPASDGVVVFGGRTGAGAVDTLLELEPDGWRIRPTSDPPAPRYGFGFAPTVDGDGEALLVFAGRDPLSRLPPSVFLLDAGSWSSIDPDATPWPSARGYPGVGYDPVRRRNLLFGGEDVEGFGDAWEWSTDTGRWWQITPAGVAPPGRFDHAQAFFPDDRQMLLFGGCVGSCEASLGDTWILERPADMRPGLVAKVAVSEAGMEIERLVIRFVGGAVGYTLDRAGIGTEQPGLVLYLWDFVQGRWVQVGSTDAGAGSADRTETIIDDGPEAFIAQGRLHLALVARTGLGNGTAPARVELDALEIRARGSAR